jgi:WhiB family redox-sensing transcriptional regulator
MNIDSRSTHLADGESLRVSPRRCADGNGTLTYLFFSEEWVDLRRAQAICAKCTSHAQCLAGALERAEPWGVWGGRLVENGRVLGDKRPRGRPPAAGTTRIVVDEVPIPEHLVA